MAESSSEKDQPDVIDLRKDALARIGFALQDQAVIDAVAEASGLSPEKAKVSFHVLVALGGESVDGALSDIQAHYNSDKPD